MTTLAIAVFCVILGSALCSGSEAALFSTSIVKVRQLAQESVTGAQALLRIRENMSRPIATIVILNNVFNIVGSIVVGGIAADVLGEEWLGVFSGLLTFAVIIGSEIIPKTIGERYAVPIALAIATPVVALSKLMLPIVWLIEKLVSPITRGALRPVTNEAEIKLLAHIGQQEGSIEEDEAALIERAFRLNDTTAGMLMTPRVGLTFLPGNKTLFEIKDLIIASQHTRMLVIGDSIDEIVGIVLKQELLLALIEGKTDQTIDQMKRTVRFVPMSARADKLLTMFQEKREHLAVVIDEFSGVAGVVTLEDVLEVLTGEIVDETDQVVDLREWARQHRAALVAGRQKDA